MNANSRLIQDIAIVIKLEQDKIGDILCKKNSTLLIDVAPILQAINAQCIQIIKITNGNHSQLPKQA